MGPEPEIGKLEKERGSLYTLVGRNKVKTHLTKVSIANGLAWNVKLKKMYYIDSPRRTVDQYDYNMEKGEISKSILCCSTLYGTINITVHINNHLCQVHELG